MSKYMHNIAKFKMVHILTYIEDGTWTFMRAIQKFKIISNDNLKVNSFEI